MTQQRSNCMRGHNKEREETRVTRFRFVRAAALIAILYSLATWTWSQAGLGTIVGTVTDTSGAIIPNAAVTVTNVTTNVAVQTKTTEAGSFTVPYLNPAAYSVRVEATGFATSEVSGIGLVLGQTARADVVMKPGATSTTVSVTAESTNTALDTDSAAVGQVISEQQVLDLPMENRSFNNLLLLAPAATTTIVNNINAGVQPASTLDIGGARGTSTGYLIDGQTNTDPWWDQPEINLSLDAIQEFKEQSSAYSAQYGGSAVQVSASVKSGTNDLHGTIYEFNRNDAFDAYPYNFGTPVTKGKLRQNQYGYSLGGPVYLPKLYNGRNRTFFFANFERFKNGSGGISDALAPTSNQIQGAVTSTSPVINPSTGTAFAQDSNGNYIIPSSDWSRLASVVLGAHPGTYFPQASGSYGGGLYNATYNWSGVNTFNQQTYRVDQRITSKDNVAARFTLTNSVSNSPGAWTAGGTAAGVTNQSWNVIQTHEFTSNLVNMARVGWTRYQNGTTGSAASTTDLSALGFQNTFPMAGAPFPNIQILTGGIACCGGAFSPTNVFTVNTWNGEDSLTWIHGRHSVSAGFLTILHGVVVNGLDIQGNFDFDGSKTAAGANPTAGNAWADFLLGLPNEGQVALPTGYSQEHPINPQLFIDQIKYAAYVNDDWKITNRLTLNLGVRYDFQSNPREENHRQFWRDLSVPDGALCSTDSTMVTTLNSPYYKVCSRSTPRTPFAPRVGFAYRPFSDDKTVLRGGYGVFFDQYSLYEFESGNIAPYIGTFNANGYSTDSLYPSEALPTVTPAQLGSLFNLEPPVIREPYLQEWSLSVERQVVRNTKFTANYVGSEGTHLETRLASNQPTSYDPSNPGAGYPFQNFGTYGQNGTPFSPGYVLEGSYAGASNYNSLQTSLDHRSNGAALLIAYTWSSAMDDSSSSGGAGLENKEWSGPMDAHDIHKDYGKSAFDVNQRFVASFVYELPIGRGKRFGSNLNRGLEEAIGGWQVNGIYSAQSGLPFNATCNDTGFVLQAYGQRCNKVGNPFPKGFHKSIHDYFDPNAYAQPATGVFGTEPHDDLRSFGLNNFDASIFKNFDLYGDNRVKFQFRAEAFNALNHPQMGQADQGFSDGNPVAGEAYGASFGTVNNTFSAPRTIQLAGKIIF